MPYFIYDQNNNQVFHCITPNGRFQFLDLNDEDSFILAVYIKMDLAQEVIEEINGDFSTRILSIKHLSELGNLIKGGNTIINKLSLCEGNYTEFERKVKDGKYRNQRYGQAFFNEFNLHSVNIVSDEFRCLLNKLYVLDGSEAKDLIHQIFDIR